MELSPDSVMLTDRVAVVTGAARGIGAATARALARFGADVAICDTNHDDLPRTVSAVEAEGRRCLAGILDVREANRVDRFLAQVMEELGPIDVLVNNAGGGFHAPFSAISPKGEAALISENFGTVTNCVRHGVGRMNDGGSIVNVTSVEALHAAPGFGVYAAMKAAVQQLTRTLAVELGERGIRVNCVAPDRIPTPGDEELAADSNATIDGMHPTPLQRVGSVDECAAAIVFLASDLAGYVTGSTLPVDGGTAAAGAWKVRVDGGFGV